MSEQVLVLAGEVSGDRHASGLVASVQKNAPQTIFFGIGGDALKARGVQLLHHVNEMAVFGLPDVIKRYSFFRSVFQEMVSLAHHRQPDLVLLVDYGGFNLRFAKKMHQAGFKVLYYICPQVWASRRSRTKKLIKFVDRLMVIFPFEASLFSGSSLRVDFVGHPLVDEARHVLASPQERFAEHGELPIALLPGSRPKEVDRNFPEMWRTAIALGKEKKEACFQIALPNEPIKARVEEKIQEEPEQPQRFRIIVGRTVEVLRDAQAALVVSGTATLQGALMSCPMVIVYRTSEATYRLAKRLVTIPYIGMVNILADRLVCPEYVQHAFTRENVLKAVLPLLRSSPERTTMLEGLRSVAASLGEGGASEKAASIVLEELKRVSKHV